MRPAFHFLLAGVLLLALVPQVRAQVTSAAELCAGDPCVIAENATVADLATLDFGDREVVLGAILDVGAGSMQITARRFAIAFGGQIRARGGALSGGGVDIETTEDIVLDGVLASGAVSMTGCDGGLLTLSAGGAITGIGDLRLGTTCSGDGSGGGLVVLDASRVALLGEIDAHGAGLGCGGSVEISAAGSIELTDVDISGGDCDAGVMTLDSFAGSVSLRDVDGDGGGQAGTGAEISISAPVSVSLTGAIRARGAADLLFGGDGGLVDVLAGTALLPGDLLAQGSIDLAGRGPEGCGGELILDGGEVELSGPVSVRGVGGQSCGGSVDVFATRTLHVSSAIVADAGSFGGSVVSLASDILMDFSGSIDVRASGALASAGEVLLDTQILLLDGSIVANATGTGSSAGSIRIASCDTTLFASGRLQALGDGGSVVFEGSGISFLLGLIETDAVGGSIDVLYRDPAQPPVIVLANVVPAPAVALRPLLPACRLPACRDRIDNDGDGRTDFDEDRGCESLLDPSEEPDCSDGLDNDGDGLFDYPDDIGCANANGRIENPQCSDGLDNDNDGRTDFDGAGVGEADPDCSGIPSNPRERRKRRCGLGFEISLLAPLLAFMSRRRPRGGWHSVSRTRTL